MSEDNKALKLEVFHVHLSTEDYRNQAKEAGRPDWQDAFVCGAILGKDEDDIRRIAATPELAEAMHAKGIELKLVEPAQGELRTMALLGMVNVAFDPALIGSDIEVDGHSVHLGGDDSTPKDALPVPVV